MLLSHIQAPHLLRQLYDFFRPAVIHFHRFFDFFIESDGGGGVKDDRHLDRQTYIYIQYQDLNLNVPGRKKLNKSL